MENKQISSPILRMCSSNVGVLDKVFMQVLLLQTIFDVTDSDRIEGLSCLYS